MLRDRHRVEWLVLLIACQPVEALDSIVNEVGTELIDLFCFWVGRSIAGSRSKVLDLWLTYLASRKLVSMCRVPLLTVGRREGH